MMNALENFKAKIGYDGMPKNAQRAVDLTLEACEKSQQLHVDRCKELAAEVVHYQDRINELLGEGYKVLQERDALKAEVERLKSEQQGELWYALDYGFEGQYYELESIIEDFESDYGTGDIEEVKVAQLTTVKHPNKFLAKLWVDGDARLFDTREEAEAAIAESKEQAND